MNTSGIHVRGIHFTMIAAVITVAGLYAQTATITGYVRNMTGQPVEGATVTIQDLGESTATDETGYYDFETMIKIVSDKKQVVQAELQEIVIKKAWYKKGWVWTLIALGVLGAGGGGAAMALSGGGDGDGEGSGEIRIQY